MLLLCALIVGGVNSVWAVDETITTMATSGEGTDFSWSTSQNGGASTPALNSGKIRLYASNQITFTAKNGKKFQTIKLTTSRNTHQWSNASSSPSGFATDTWTASDETTTSVTITNGNTGSGNLQISQFDITYVTEGEGGIDKPKFSATGAVAAGTQIYLTHDDADEIRYTTDGTTAPTKTIGTVYTTPITITEAITIKAIAIKGDEVSDVATVNFTITVADPIFTPGTGNYLQGSNLTLTSTGNTIYYTDDGKTPNNTKTQYTAPIVIPNGKTTYKAIAYDSYGNTSNVVTATITGVAPVTLPFSWAKGTTRSTINSTTGVSQTGLDGDYSDDDYKLKFNGDNDNIIIYTDEKPVKVTIGVKMIGGGKTSKFSIQESTNGAVFTEVEQLTISGSQNDVVNLETTANFTSTTRAIKLNFIKGDNVGVGPLSITAEPATITLNAACTDGENIFGTYSNSKAFVVPADLTVSTVKLDGEGKLVVSNYSTGDVVKANTGVMVSAASAGDKSVNLSSETGTEHDGNMLKASSVAMTGSNKFYRLTMHNATSNPPGIIGFWWGADDGAAFDIDANKAYLAVPTTSAPSFLWFNMEDTSGLEEITSHKNEVRGAYYNLNGQRVANPTKGLYIVNGRKVVIK